MKIECIACSRFGLVILSFIDSKDVLAQELNWSDVADISATGQQAYEPQISPSSDGTKATAVWYRHDGLNYIVQSVLAIGNEIGCYVIISKNDQAVVFCL